MQNIDFTKDVDGIVTVTGTGDEAFSIRRYPWAVEILPQNDGDVYCYVKIKSAFNKYFHYATKIVNISFAGVPCTDKASLEATINDYLFSITL